MWARRALKGLAALPQPDGHSGVFPTQKVLTVGSSIESSSAQCSRAPSHHARVFHFCQSCLCAILVTLLCLAKVNTR